MGEDISNHSKWFVFTLCFIVLLGPMNAVLFNVALEDIAHDLSISQSKVSWVVVGYSLVVGLGLYNLINFFGMAFGPAVASKIMESTNSYRFNFILIVMLISAHFFLLIGMSSFQKKMEH